MSLAWVYLLIAGVFEFGWPVGLKNASGDEGFIWYWALFAAVSLTLSGTFLYFAQKTIPMGTAYAVWTGIGATGTFLIGVAFFGDYLTSMRVISILLIIGGVIGLKLS